MNTKLIELGLRADLRAWCKTTDYGPVLSDLVAKASAALADAGIKDPDPTVYYMERK